MASLFHSKKFLAGILALVMVSLACSTAAPATQKAATPLPWATDTLAATEVTANETPEQPTREPAQETTPMEQVVPQADFDGVTFAYDPQIAASVAGEEVAAVNSDQGALWEVQPVTVKFSFEGYPVTDSFTDPVILVFPVKDFEKMSEEAAKIIDELRQVIADQADNSKGLPFLPTWNAGQIFHSKVVFFKFTNGRGVRYLTQYGQGTSPVNNKYLFYTFQGLTTDGKYYISAILPVTNAILPPDDSSIPGGDYQKFTEDFQTYITGMKEKLDAQPEDAFIPNLTVLDSMLKSLAVNK